MTNFDQFRIMINLTEFFLNLILPYIIRRSVRYKQSPDIYTTKCVCRCII